jgi:hypothetical protein
VRADSVDDVAVTVLHQLGADISLVLAEAVAQETFARWLLVPDGHPEILRLEAIASVAEVHRRADRIAAESITGLLDSSEGHLREQCLDGLQLNRGTPPATVGTVSCAGFERG